MKKTVFLASSLLFVTVAIAQSDFEGILTYRNNLVSKTENITSATWKKIIGQPDEVTTMVKDGNFKQSSNKSEVYIFPRQGKAYAKFKGYDTLYVIDVTADTSNVLSVTKDPAKKTIAGYNCNALTIRTTAATYTYFYSPSIHMNPAVDDKYRLSREDIFRKETGSLFLSEQEENKNYLTTQTCVKVEQRTVDLAAFTLPDLPQKELTPTSFAASFFRIPQFSGEEGWAAFLQKKLDPDVAAKYVKIGRKETSASQAVYVSFTVSEAGNVLNASVDNKKEVPSKLAEEALRVISISHWRPATVFGQPIPYRMKAPITFSVVKE